MLCLLLVLVLVLGLPLPLWASPASNVTVPLAAGWNAVGLQCQQLTALSANPQVAGVATWNGSSFAIGNYSLAEFNAGAGGRRGFWVFATGASNFTYSGVDDGQGAFVDLVAGYNLVSFSTSTDVAGSSLQATQNSQPVALGSVVLPTFFEIQTNQYASVDVTSGGILRAGRAYWVFATASTRLTLGGTPSPSPLPVTLSETASITLGSGVFGGLVYDGTDLVASWGRNNQLVARRLDTNLYAVGAEVNWTTPADNLQVTDHKHLFLDNQHFVTFSTVGDDDLYLVRYAATLNRTGSIVPVVTNTTTTRTNDMYLATDNSTLRIGRFSPSNLNGLGASGHIVSQHSLSLASAGPEVPAVDPSHQNGASCLFNGAGFEVFAANGGDLLRIVYNGAFARQSNQTLRSNSANEFFPTGVVRDGSGRTILGYMVGAPGTSGIQAAGDVTLEVFNSAWQSLGIQVVETGSARPHLLLLGNALYCIYDTLNTVRIRKYQVQ